MEAEFVPANPHLRHLECRDWGHAWKLAYLAREVPGVLVRRLDCIRCETERYDYLTRSNGEIDGRIYHYAENYLIKGEGKPDKQTLRLELTKELLKFPAFKRAAGEVKRRGHRG